MRKGDRRRDMLLQKKREKQRIRKQTKPSHDPHSCRQMGTDKVGFSIFNWLSRAVPESQEVLDRRERRNSKRGDR